MAEEFPTPIDRVGFVSTRIYGTDGVDIGADMPTAVLMIDDDDTGARTLVNRDCRAPNNSHHDDVAPNTGLRSHLTSSHIDSM